MNVFAPNAAVNPGIAQAAGSRIASFVSRMFSLATTHRRERSLRLCEMLSLGEKRFIAVVEYGQEKFLLAGTPQNISLLKKFDGNSQGIEEAQRSGSNPE